MTIIDHERCINGIFGCLKQKAVSKHLRLDTEHGILEFDPPLAPHDYEDYPVKEIGPVLIETLELMVERGWLVRTNHQTYQMTREGHVEAMRRDRDPDTYKQVKCSDEKLDLIGIDLYGE